MAITEASDRMGSAGLTNRNKQSCGNIFFKDSLKILKVKDPH